MAGISTSDAVHSLQEAMASMPSDLDARSDFFVQWRARTIQILEAAFPDDHEPALRFKDIEFSPRLLGKNEGRDAQLKLDAYLAGCAAAQAMLDDLIRRLVTPAPAATSSPELQQPQPPQGSPVLKESQAQQQLQVPQESQMPQESRAPQKLQAPQESPVPQEPQPSHESRASQERHAPQEFQAPPESPAPQESRAPKEPQPPQEFQPPPRQPLVLPPQPAPPREDSKVIRLIPSSKVFHTFSEDVIKGAIMDSRDLCLPVRSSLSRVLGAWDRGDRNMALMLSAQLLADLKVLSHSDQFKAAFENVMTNAMDSGMAAAGLDALKSAAPLCVWSMVAAMNEVMK